MIHIVKKFYNALHLFIDDGLESNRARQVISILRMKRGDYWNMFFASHAEREVPGSKWRMRMYNIKIAIF